MEKVCCHCHMSQPLTNFRKRRSAQDGLALECNTCMAASAARWYKNGGKEKTAQYRRDNAETLRLLKSAYYQKNKEKFNRLSKAWSKAHPKERAAHEAKRRALKNNAPVAEKIDRDYIFKRDKGICQLCMERCAKKDASLDHIIPLSKGGEHTKRNVVLAHRNCNAVKKNRTVTQQLLLIG